MLAQEVFVANIQTTLRKLSSNLPRGLLSKKPLHIHSLLLRSEAAKEASRLKLLCALGLIRLQTSQTKTRSRFLGAKVGLVCLLLELLLGLTSSFLLLLCREPKPGCFLPGRLSCLVLLQPKLRTKLPILLTKTESFLLELLLCLARCLFLLLGGEAKASCFLPRCLPSLVGLQPKLGAELTFLLAEAECLLLELLLRLTRCFFLLLRR